MMINQLKNSKIILNKGLIVTCYFLADIRKIRLIGIGTEIEEITGYPYAMFQNPTAKFIKKLIHTNDFKKLEMIRQLLFYYGKKQTGSNTHFSITEDFRLKHAAGHLVNIDMEISVLQYDKKGFPNHIIGEIHFLNSINELQYGYTKKPTVNFTFN